MFFARLIALAMTGAEYLKSFLLGVRIKISYKFGFVLPKPRSFEFM